MGYVNAYPRSENSGQERKMKGGSTMNAKAFLNQIKKLDRLIENKQNERERWLMLAVNTTAGAAPDTGVRVQSSGSKQRMADAVIRSVDIETEINDTIRKLYDARQQIIGVIEQLPTEEYDLLHKLFVGEVSTDRQGHKRFEYMSLQDAADRNGKSYSWARTLKGIALQKVQRIIDEQKIEPVVEQMKRWNCG